MREEKLKLIVFTGMLTALTFVATFIIKLPSPTGGYIHPGDVMVVLSGALLGPVYGSFAAGIGSALADIVGGYFIYAPVTLVIKALCAGICALLINRLGIIRSALISESVMVLGYFASEIFILAAAGGQMSLVAGVSAAALNIPANLVQGAFGCVGAVLLYPALKALRLGPVK